MKKRFISSFIEAKFLIARCLTLLILALLSTNLAWGEDITIAFWGKVSLAANTAVNASSYQGTTAPKLTSSKALTSSGSGTSKCYYGGSAGGATITVAGLPSGYKTNKITFYSRASKSGNMNVSYSTDNGVTYESAGSASLNATESLKTVTLSTPVSNITNIKFEHSATSGSLYFGTVTITGPSNKTEQTLSFSSTEFNLNVGETFTEPILSGAQTTVSYTSDNANVASVDENTGDVTINGDGTAVITATAEENETYSEGTASYTINVTTNVH